MDKNSFQIAADGIKKEAETKTANPTATATTAPAATATVTAPSTATEPKNGTTEPTNIVAPPSGSLKELLKNAKADEVQALLKELNIAPPQAAPEVKETPEAKVKRESIERQNAIAFAIQNGADEKELLRYKTLEGKNNEEIVREEFRKNYLKEHPNAKEETVNRRFETQYKPQPLTLEVGDEGYEAAKAQYDEDLFDYNKFVDSRAEKLKGRALEPLTNAVKQYSTFEQNQQLDKKYDSDVNTFLDTTAFKTTFEIEGEKIDFEVPASDREAIRQKISTDYKIAHAINLGKEFNLEEQFKERVAAKYFPQLAMVYGKSQFQAGEKKGLEPYKNPMQPQAPASGQDLVQSGMDIAKAAEGYGQANKKRLGN